MKKEIALPDLPFEAWKETRLTVHLILQIIGKARLKLTTRKNHWWYITLYVTSRGFGTHSIPVNDGLDTLEIDFNILEKAVVLSHSSYEPIHISLLPNPTIAEFYGHFMKALASFDLHPKFIEKPLDLGIETRFDAIKEYHHYDWKYIQTFWKLMRWNHAVFQEFSGRFYGKTCPVHIYWHHMDLTVTRVSDKKLPPMDKSARILERDTYSHEQISFGFWAGDDNMSEPMYYAYTYPSPEGLDEEPLSPDAAHWVDSNGSPMALLRYETVRNSENPRTTVLDFLESAYQAGAKRAKWNVTELTVPSLEDI
ncbi:DUF5996 family protein [Ulvibacterium sp.]|uniref:DUF5996 family protein n=1 Tax=Ulvibacterium sp. TaxID=2665914 RepID=UPI003CC6286F